MDNENEDSGWSNWFKKHNDLIVIITFFSGGLLWMNGKFNDIEKDIAIIKTVLVMKNIMPSDLAKCEHHEVKKAE